MNSRCCSNRPGDYSSRLTTTDGAAGVARCAADPAVGVRMFAARSPARYTVADLRFVAMETMPDMIGTSRTAGYVVLTSVAALLEIVRYGWHETRTDEEYQPPETHLAP